MGAWCSSTTCPGLYVCRSHASPPRPLRLPQPLLSADGVALLDFGLDCCRQVVVPSSSGQDRRLVLLQQQLHSATGGRRLARPAPWGRGAARIRSRRLSPCRCLFVSEPGPLACTSVIAATLRRGRPPTCTAHPTGACAVRPRSLLLSPNRGPLGGRGEHCLWEVLCLGGWQ